MYGIGGLGSRVFGLSLMLVRSESFMPVGLIFLATVILNLVTTDLFVYTFHRGRSEAEAFLVHVLPLSVIKGLSPTQFFLESLNPVLALTVINWWVTVPGQLSSGWKWRYRRYSALLNFLVRLAELVAGWCLLIFHPTIFGSGFTQCPLDDPSVRYETCEGCCRGPVVQRECAFLAIIFTASQIVAMAVGWPRQNRCVAPRRACLKLCIAPVAGSSTETGRLCAFDAATSNL